MPPIKGLTNQLRMPRAGKIHLGIKSSTASGAEHPTPTDYFVCPQNVIDALGDDKPRELTIMFPTDEPEQFASADLKLFSRTRGLVCKGDGETADRTVNMRAILGPEGVIDNIPNTPEAWPVVDRDALPKDIGRHKIECRGAGDKALGILPCPQYGAKGCGRMMMLQFLLPGVPGLGIYQIDTGSRNSILNVYGGIELVRAIVGRVAMVPLKLRIGPIQTVSPETGRQQINYVLSLDCDLTLENLSRYKALGAGPDLSTRQLPDPDDELPEYLMSSDMPDPVSDTASQVMAPPRPTQPAPPRPAPPAPRAEPQTTANHEPKTALRPGYGQEVWGMSVSQMGQALKAKREELFIAAEALKAKAREIGLDDPRQIKHDQFMELMDWMAAEDAASRPFLAQLPDKARVLDKVDSSHIHRDIFEQQLGRMGILNTYEWGELTAADLARVEEWVDKLDAGTEQESNITPISGNSDPISEPENVADIPDVVSNSPQNGPDIPDVVSGAETTPDLGLLPADIPEDYSWDQVVALASERLGIRTRGAMETQVLHMPIDDWEKLGGTAATAARRLLRTV